MSTKPGIYHSTYYGDGDVMVVVVGNDGRPRVVSDDLNSLVEHDASAADRLLTMWRCTPGKVVPADSVVIARADMPEVTTQSGLPQEVRTGPYRWHLGEVTAESARAEGMAALALAEYLDAHPPINEADVQATLSALKDATGIGDIPMAHVDRVVRALIAAPDVTVVAR